jgi:hypothetical protein
VYRRRQANGLLCSFVHNDATRSIDGIWLVRKIPAQVEKDFFLCRTSSIEKGRVMITSRYGIKRHPVSKIAAKAAQGAWACTKESIANTNSNRTVVSGGNRRFDGTKPQGREIPTPSMDLRATPVRHLYSRADRQRDPASTEWLSNNNKKTQTQIRVQGADRKIVRPSSAPLQRSYGSQLQVRPARISASEHVQTETIGQVKHSHRNHIPRDDTRATHNAQGQRILRPWSALQHRVTSGVMVPQQTPSQRSLSVLENAGPTPHTKKTATKRPASARPASAHGIRPPSTLVPVRQRPASAMGRVREWNFPSWLTSGNLRPSSAMLCDQVLEKRGDDSEVSGGEHGMENPFGSIASSEAHQYLNDPMIMTAEHQLKIMAEKKTHSVVARLLPSQRKSVSGGLKGLIRSHKKDIHLLARKSFVQDLEKTLVEYEERDIERYKLPFADLFLTVHSGRQLPKDPKTSSCDPYLVLTLKDSERGHVAECKTSVIQGNPNPDWKSDFQLNCRNLEKDAILTFNCWHKSTFSRFDDVLLGECSLELRRLKLATSEEWNLRLRASVEHDFDSRIKITTFYGNEEAHKKWKTEVEERRKKQRALAQEKAREQGSSPVPRRSPSPKSVEEVSGRTSSSPINFSPGGSKNPAHNGIHQASDDQASTFINDAARPSSSSQSKMNCQWTMIRENGYSQDIVNEICSTYGHEAWDKLGIGVDVFDFLSLLQKREQGRMSIQTVDFLEPAPRTGTAHQIFPDAETIDLEHVRSFPDELLLYMSQYGGSHIKRLCIGGSNNLTLSAVLVFARGFPLISSLSLNGLRSADDGWISSLAELLHLQELLVSECNNITDRGLMAMVGSSSGLRKLDCSYCFKISDLGIDALAKNCAGLESVNIRGCHNVTAAAISGLFQHCPHLANVDISGLQGISSGIFAASSNLQELRSLNVANCRAFDDKALQYLARLDSMESIIMYANPGVTDIGLAAIATCKNLQTLSLARCSKVTDGGIIKVATGCRHIRRLNLDFCTLVSDNGILFIADFHAELESLSVRGCTQVTGVGVGCVIQHCPRIAALDLAHTGVDQGEIQSALADVQERRTRDQKVEQMAWLAGKKGTSTWSGIEASF